MYCTLKSPFNLTAVLKTLLIEMCFVLLMCLPQVLFSVSRPGVSVKLRLLAPRLRWAARLTSRTSRRVPPSPSSSCPRRLLGHPAANWPLWALRWFCSWRKTGTWCWWRPGRRSSSSGSQRCRWPIAAFTGVRWRPGRSSPGKTGLRWPRECPTRFRSISYTKVQNIRYIRVNLTKTPFLLSISTIKTLRNYMKYFLIRIVFVYITCVSLNHWILFCVNISCLFCL